MKQCFGYVRVSTQKQGEGVSLEAQRDAIEAYARREGLEISEWFEEKETAAKGGRPVFNRMLKALQNGRARGMIIHKIDRSARNLRDWAAISDLSDAGIDVHFATESLDFRSRGGRLTADIQAVIAADYIRNLRDETIKGIRGRLKQGLYPWPAPIGYLDMGGGKPKILDPIRAPLVKELFRLYLRGDHSIRSLQRHMASAGLTGPTGRPIPRRTVETVLQNPFYCGQMLYRRTGEIFDGVHEPLITVQQFQQIQAIKEGRYVKKSTRHDHLLRRLFHCALCGEILTPERQKQRYTYYRCHTVGCAAKTAREEHLNGAIIAALAKFELSESQHKAVEVEYKTWRAHHGHEEERTSLDLRLARAQSRMDRLVDLFLDGKITQDQHDQKRETLTFEIARLREGRRVLENRSARDEDRAKFLELMKSLAALYISATPAEKRVLVENCFSNRLWDGKNVELTPSNLVTKAQSGLCVPYGCPTRDTLRIFVEKLDGRGLNSQ